MFIRQTLQGDRKFRLRENRTGCRRDQNRDRRRRRRSAWEEGLRQPSGQMKTLPSSSITNPMMAAMTTAWCERRFPKRSPDYRRTRVCSVTTDGFLSSIPVEAVDITGRGEGVHRGSHPHHADNATIWEEKHRIGRALVTKTRGTITIEPLDVDDPGTPV